MYTVKFRYSHRDIHRVYPVYLECPVHEEHEEHTRVSEEENFGELLKLLWYTHHLHVQPEY